MKQSLSLLALVGCLFLAGCTRIGAGHVGVKISQAGSNRGVEDIPTTTGWVFYNPILSNVYEYPTFMQSASWTGDEEITFTTKDSMAVSAAISIGYQLKAEKVPAFYVKFRSDNLDLFTHGFLRNIARDHFKDVAGKYAVEQIMGDSEAFVKDVKARLQTDLEPLGVSIEQFGIIGAPKPPPSVIESINQKVGASQLALQKQNEIIQAEAEAKKAVAKAQGEAESNIARARGEAEANRILTESINGALIQWRQLSITEQAINKWDGARPMVEGNSNGLLMEMPFPKQK